MTLIVTGENCTFQRLKRKKSLAPEEGKQEMLRSLPGLPCPGTVLGMARSDSSIDFIASCTAQP